MDPQQIGNTYKGRKYKANNTALFCEQEAYFNSQAIHSIGIIIIISWTYQLFSSGLWQSLWLLSLSERMYTSHGYRCGFYSELCLSRARRWNGRIASYVTVSERSLAVKYPRKKTATVAARSICFILETAIPQNREAGLSHLMGEVRKLLLNRSFNALSC